ncbi:CotO family spore coat protein, partial [Neobacillus drentensis]|uniref:CotO family spore coat protein n=1 Tax=Neobacillus drentensis TaxID=220684 RepID=UPI002FFFB0CB
SFAKEEMNKTLSVAKEEMNKTHSVAKEDQIMEEEPKLEQPESQTTVIQKQKRESRSSLKKVKPFKEMDLNERLNYLINFPKVLSPVTCVFSTEKRKVQGYLTEYTDQFVTISLKNQTSETIPLEQLTNVMMIGIKR